VSAFRGKGARVVAQVKLQIYFEEIGCFGLNSGVKGGGKIITYVFLEFK
jgi:hypothetical protein